MKIMEDKSLCISLSRKAGVYRETNYFIGYPNFFSNLGTAAKKQSAFNDS